MTVSLAELGGTVALVDPSQFFCYKLAGSNLVKALDGPDIFPPIDPRTGIGVGYGNWATGGV